MQSSAHLRSAEENRFEKSPDVVPVRYINQLFLHRIMPTKRIVVTRRTHSTIITPIIISCYHPAVWLVPRTSVSGAGLPLLFVRAFNSFRARRRPGTGHVCFRGPENGRAESRRALVWSRRAAFLSLGVALTRNYVGQK